VSVTVVLPVETGGALISRILHPRMLPDRQAIDDEDDKPDST